jgi:hypothetical protein
LDGFENFGDDHDEIFSLLLLFLRARGCGLLALAHVNNYSGGGRDHGDRAENCGAQAVAFVEPVKACGEGWNPDYEKGFVHEFFENPKNHAPQRLKPNGFYGACGMTEVMP